MVKAWSCLLYTEQNVDCPLFLKSLYQIFFLILKTIIIIKILERLEYWRILHSICFLFCKTTLILFKLHQFKSIWCLSGKHFAFSFLSPPCQIQPSTFLFASWILLVLHDPFTYTLYYMEDKMHHPYGIQWNAAHSVPSFRKKHSSWY